jgi:hypothetical protein
MNIYIAIIMILLCGLIYFIFFNKTDKDSKTNEDFVPNIYMHKFLPKKEDVSLINIEQPVQILPGLHRSHLQRINLNNIENDDKNEFLLKPYPNENYKIDMYTPSVVYKEVHTFDKNHTLDFLKKDVPQTFEDYELKGIIANKYYQQYFILYTKPYVIDNRMDGLYHYILVQKVDGELKIIHTIPPRLEIIDGDIMYFNYGNFSLGPFMFV